ncbi:MAG: PAS domain S-box protein [Bryobacteraceae bacterium]|jgi:PAS domain S-box-containing protein
MKSSLSSAGVVIVVVVALAITVATHSLLAGLPFATRMAVYSIATLLLFAVVYRLTLAVTYWRRTEEAYRLIFEDASDAIAIAGPALKILEVNARATEVFGYSRQDLLRMNLKDLLALEERAGAPQKLERVLGKGETALYERRFQRPDGETTTAEISVRALRDGRLIAIGRDVTARRRAEEALRASEALTRSVVYSAVDGIITADESGTIQSFNPAAERMFGYAAEEAIGQNLRILMPQPDRDRHDAYIRTYLESGKKKIIGIGREAQAVRKDGTSFPIELAVSEMLLPGRRLFTGILHDITHRKAAEAALMETNAKLQAIIETSPLAIVTLDLGGRVLAWNPAAERMFGWSAAEALNRVLPVVPEAERTELLDRVRSGEPLLGAEKRRLRKDGSLIDTTLWTAPLRDSAGEVSGVMGIYADVTQSKQLEEQFQQAQKMEAVGRLAGGIAHDFNNILTVITGYGEMVAERITGDPLMSEEMQEILKAADHATVLTSQLLIFSRRHVAIQESLDLNTVVAKLERMLRRIIGEDVELVTVPGPELARVRADAAQIEQVIMNLAVNSRDAMPGGGRLVIETANVELDAAYGRGHIGVKEGEYVMLAVSDTGKGIPPEVRSRLFEPFFTTKERGKGTGLGLSTVYGIVKQSGGEIRVYSELDKGTTFKIYLPRVTDADSQPAQAAEPSPVERGEETLLLAEDEPGVRALARDVLRQHGYQVLEALDVPDALRICREHPERIHLLLTDVVMPVMSGRELAERVAQIRPEIKVLYMSGYTDNIVVSHGVTSIDKEFLQKPFTPRSLARKVRETLDRPV